MAAVSARRIVAPREANLQPAARKAASSESVHPPSGPMASTISPLAVGIERTSASLASASDSASRTRGATRQGHGFFQLQRLRNFRRPRAAGLLGSLPGDALPAFHPFRGSRRQASFGAPRNDGNDAPTPSSVHFSIAHSMRSNLKMESASVRLGKATAGTGSPSSNSTRS